MNTHNTDEDLVRALYNKLVEQWNKRSATGFAGLFVSNGSMVGFDGSQLNGQSQIYEVFADIFGNFPTAAYITIIKDVRLLSPDSAVLLAVAGMVPQGADDISPAVSAVQSLTAVKELEQWRIALVQNTPAAFHGRPELGEQLSSDLRFALQLSKSN